MQKWGNPDGTILKPKMSENLKLPYLETEEKRD